MRRTFGALLTILAVTLVYQSAFDLHAQVMPGSLEIKLDLTATMPSRSGPALTLTHADDGSNRIFAGGRIGRVELIKDGAVQETPFLDMRDLRDEFRVTTSGEGGLLGMAFHPDFDSAPGSPGAGKLYTHTTETRGEIVPDFNHPELEANDLGAFHSVIREWTVSADNPDLVDISIPSRVLMRVNQPQGNHDGGAIAFGPDDNLYLALGDGGGGGDSSGNRATDGHSNGDRALGIPPGNGQDITNVYGTILRIDPLGTNSANGQYGIPADNPFVNQPGVDEIFAYGLRNPFKMSFDRQTGELFAGDVGQSSVEEVDIIVSGGNYGWAVKEGTRTFSRGFDQTGMIDPIAEYTHRDGVSVIGGFVYRGTAIPELMGQYVFGDFSSTGSGPGRLFYLDPANPEIFEFNLDPNGEGIRSQIFAFGEDEAGELYVLFGNRQIMQITRPQPALQAGDANQDLQFDQDDIVQVSIADKYLTGQAASWGEGDWNGAPGGEPGSPPTGDGLFNQLDVIASQLNALYLTGPYAAIGPDGNRGDGQTSIIYDANTGEIAVDAPAGIDLTSVNIDSATGIFTGQPARNLGGSFDNDADNNLFKATFGSSFGSLSFGNVAQPILTEAFVRSDLTVVGSLAGGGDLGAVDLIYIPLPEPSAFCLLIMGVLGAIARRWPVGRSS